MGFSAITASRNITEKYKRYLRTIFHIADEKYQSQFEEELNKEENFAKGPFLDVTDSFLKAESIEELMNDGTLSSYFRFLHLRHTRCLYSHQVRAIRQAGAGKNLVVSTGTGSGKTESFLIPIFQYILKNIENGTLENGIKAMIIYPMNALANDQIERLRGILQEYPQITFGAYTGQTCEKYNDALAEYKQLNDGKNPLPNELICREDMRKNPPHLFITNYAMLEYLMLRPGDNVFFASENTQQWQFIVLDEAHVYHGSTGIEVSMLLRRLKAALCREKMQYILTSATLGGEEDNEAVAAFASDLCASTFTKEDIIRADRILLKPENKLQRIPLHFYTEMACQIDASAAEDTLRDVITRELQTVKISVSDITISVEELLYRILLIDENYWALRNILTSPLTISETARKMHWTEEEVAAFVTVASLAEKNGDKLFDARYHMFMRATESTFITLSPSHKLFLDRRNTHTEQNGIPYHVFEIAVCSSCGAIYLTGKSMGNNGPLEQTAVHNPDERVVFLLEDEISDTDEDHTVENEQIEVEKYEICSRCGYFVRRGTPERQRCEHGSAAYVNVIRVHAHNDDGKVTKCLKCEAFNSTGILRSFFTGQEAVTSVLGTALYQELPSYRIIQRYPQVQMTADEDWGFGGTETQIIADNTKERIAKQFIAFSDSRQAAAFYATYLDRTYRSILYKRLILEALKNLKYQSGIVSLDVLASDASALMEQYGILPVDQTIKEGWKAVLAEAVDNNGTTSLYAMGMLGFSLLLDKVQDNPRLQLTKEEITDLCAVFAEGMMADGAIQYPEPMDIDNRAFFTYNGIEHSYTLADSDVKECIRAFIPKTKNKTNKRLDYLERVLNAKNIEISREQCTKILEQMWTFFILPITADTGGRKKLRSDRIIVETKNKWYICSRCGKITSHNVADVCPGYRCDGKLMAIAIDEHFQNHHYYRLYQDLEIRELRVVEHTAQLDRETAYEYQKKFVNKQLDVLSCSTTFEMGVDVGTLETVFMRNMPPSPANYAQRAGRAGRSTQSAAYALTFCNKSNHDFTYYQTPEKMIRGKIDPPHFKVSNEKIAIRHLYAAALGYFWRSYPEYYRDAQTMLEKPTSGFCGVAAFEQYLSTHPVNLREYAGAFLPADLQNVFGIPEYGWIETLFCQSESDPGIFTKVMDEYRYEIATLDEAREQAFSAGKKADYLGARLKTYRSENILTFLSRKNILPKYGFPVDTVEMYIPTQQSGIKYGLQLQRDLGIAISEYAPDSQIVANGYMITSRYIRKVPNLGWKMYDYIRCKDCQTLNIETHITQEDISPMETCSQCGKPLQTNARKTFLIPGFGFEADSTRIKKPGLIRPEKTYRGDVFYVGYKNDITTVQYRLGNAQYELTMSRGDEMAVLNESPFFVCESCGYTVLEDKAHFMKQIKKKHKTPMGRDCQNHDLHLYSLGYRFKTDILILKFLNPELQTEYREEALSVLYAILKGICTYLNIEQGDVSGCLHYFVNEYTHHGNYALVLYDQTPGGAGHVHRLLQEGAIALVLRETLAAVNECTCGGETADTSCYACLRSYYNQKYHDMLKRNYVIEFLNRVFL